MIPVCLQGKPFNITVIQVYAPTSNSEEAEVEWFYEDLQDLLELTCIKDVLFIIGDWNAEVGSQETPGCYVTSVMSDSLRPHRWQPTRLPHPWESPGKNTGVGCHFLLQETPGVTGKFGLGMQNEAGQRLMEFCQDNTLVIANTIFQQHKRRLYTWTSPDGHYRNQIDYILCNKEFMI